ncbi:beta-lactamase family protein [Pseudoalteromonas luteoviolacea]|uniref:serine hydrolase domain-containing protein n=1 Tax=Pseudoalteromonas luteoviolacea TaxID=43657 RepID=UPI001B391A18|nr:serine hydrolase domain-containing protein [Pseudoalteromonas luteoviolacea]MBQ4811399.1 beta-lactamase family protein [Pseudoalteromonas luteoviolacea]
MDKLDTAQIDGYLCEKFSPIHQAFERNFVQFSETGAAVCIFHKGKLAAHLYGSYHSPNGPWADSDRVAFMSCSKALLAICIHLLAARKVISLDAPVKTYWPEFANNGKRNITIDAVLNHTAGLPSHNTGSSGDIFEWQKTIHNIERAKPIFLHQQKLAYHALTFGHILGEIIHRVDGRTPSQFFKDEIAVPFDINCALTKDPQFTHRAIINTKAFSPSLLYFMSHWLPIIPHWKCQFFRQCNTEYHPNSLSWSQGQIPAVTGHGSAYGLAKLYAFLAQDGALNNQQLLPRAQVRKLRELSIAGRELTTNMHWRMGSGIMLNSPPFCDMGPNQESFGHMGMGGSIGFADPKAQLSFAFVSEHFHQPHKNDPSIGGRRMQNLIKACYQCL